MLSLNCLAKEKERGDFALCFFGGRGGGVGWGRAVVAWASIKMLQALQRVILG